MPAASQAAVVSVYQSSMLPAAVRPHELLTTLGRFDGSGSLPSVLVGATIHCPDERSAASEQLSQPFVAIQSAPGATPIWLPLPSSPTMVPMVCVPWPLSSNGSSAEPEVSCQL